MTYEEQLQTSEWKELTHRIKTRDEHSCQLCFNKNNLQVHHKAYISGRMAWEYEDNYLITLCDGCHSKVHGQKPDHESYDRGEPYESEFYQDKWREIRRGVDGIIGLTKAIAKKEFEAAQKKKEEEGNG